MYLFLLCQVQNQLHQWGYPQHGYHTQELPVQQAQPIVDLKYVLKKSGPLGSLEQSSAAANFFSKSANYPRHDDSHSQRHNPVGSDEYSSGELDSFPTNFRALVHRSPPQIPSQLIKKLEDTSVQSGSAKIKVYLRMTRSSSFDIEDESNKFVFLDRHRKQVTLFDPCKGSNVLVSPEDRGIGITAPKMYAFDGVFTSDDPQVSFLLNNQCNYFMTGKLSPLQCKPTGIYRQF